MSCSHKAEPTNPEAPKTTMRSDPISQPRPSLVTRAPASQPAGRRVLLPVWRTTRRLAHPLSPGHRVAWRRRNPPVVNEMRPPNSPYHMNISAQYVVDLVDRDEVA